MKAPTGEAGQPARASIYDVAALAGVSHQTVSRVLNNHPNIKATTREKVLRAISESNYTPSSIARALATRRTKRIGVLIDSTNRYGPSSTLFGVEEAARALGYSIIAASVSDALEMDLVSSMDHLAAQGAEAICVIAPRHSALESMPSPGPGVPMLVISAKPRQGILSASVDQYGGATLAVQHLISLGHQRIAHLGGPQDWIDAQERLRAWRDCVQAAGLPLIEPVMGDWTSEFGYAYGSSDRLPGDATAVFVANDQMALGVIHGLHSRGIRVPEDVSIVGFDDLPDAPHFLPPLTTVRQDFHALGTASLTMLINALGGESSEPELIPAELVLRDSATAPRQR